MKWDEIKRNWKSKYEFNQLKWIQINEIVTWLRPWDGRFSGRFCPLPFSGGRPLVPLKFNSIQFNSMKSISVNINWINLNWIFKIFFLLVKLSASRFRWRWGSDRPAWVVRRPRRLRPSPEMQQRVSLSLSYDTKMTPEWHVQDTILCLGKVGTR